MSSAPDPPPLRRHQAEALAAIEEAWEAGRARTWVVLPPGVGKTRLGVEAALRRDGKAVVLGPNTAIQTQWESEARALGVATGVDRELGARLTALTYQSLAVFDPDAEVDEEGSEGDSLLARLHPNGQELVATLRAAGPILVVLDECHHLLDVWGWLLAELLEGLPEATVLGLTATPPGALTTDQATLVADLFGETVYEATIPAAVREGELAPFAESVWLTTPTPGERDWLQEQATRFTELSTRLTDPGFGSLSFLTWLDRRFVHSDVPWSGLLRREPRLCAAALRMHHHGLLALPPGAGLGEEYRREPDADDWMVLLEDWMTHHLLRTGSAADEQVVDAVRRALPSIGYRWTRAGIRPGRTPVDRVLARSAAKADGAVEIVRSESTSLGPRMRTLVLCDHERAGPTGGADLDGVLDPQSGAAQTMLARLAADPDLVGLHPLLVTARTVAGTSEALADLRAFVADHDADLGAALEVRADPDTIATLSGPWTSRTWLPLVTQFFESGRSQILVGTRGLLGEGWDARRITALVDLTAVTTTTAVVQARGRALRLDPQWPEKVAINWSVVCVADGHPKGTNDWDRLVRKHRGFLGVDDTGTIIDGVAHIDPAFSPYAPPPTDSFAGVNARMLARADDRPRLRELWRVGSPYDGALRVATWIRSTVAERLPTRAEPPDVVVDADRLTVADGVVQGRARPAGRAALLTVATGQAALLGLGAWAGVSAGSWGVFLILLGCVAVLSGTVLFTRAAVGRRLLTLAAEPPGVVGVAHAVADALGATGLSRTGPVPTQAEQVRVDVEPDGTHRCWLAGVDEEQSALFATAVDEALAPLGRSRYLLPCPVVGQPPYGLWRSFLAAEHLFRPVGTSWYPVPTALGVRRELADAYAAAWRRHVGGCGAPIYTGSAEGAGILAAQQGSDPFEVDTVMRRHWS